MKMILLAITIFLSTLILDDKKPIVGQEENFFFNNTEILANNKKNFKNAETNNIQNILEAYTILKKYFSAMIKGDITNRENKTKRKEAIKILKTTLKENTIIKTSKSCFFTKFYKTVNNAFTLSCTGEKRIYEDTGILFIIFDNTTKNIFKEQTTSKLHFKKFSNLMSFSGSIKIIKISESAAAGYGEEFSGTFTATNQSLRIYCKILSID